MGLRQSIQHNLGLKIIALLLATLTWLTVRFAIHQEQRSQTSSAGLVTNTWTGISILVLRDARDLNLYELSPSEATVTAVGEAPRIRQLRAKDFKLFVDFGARQPAIGAVGNIEVIYPAGIETVLVAPATARVNGVTPMELPKPGLKP